MTLGTTGAAAGTSYQQVDFQNRGSQPCTLTGYPGVSFTDSGGSQVGYPASRNPSASPVTVTLASGEYATAAVGIPDYGNFPSNLCRARSASNLRVYPPNQRGSVLVPDMQTVCTTTNGRPSVTTVRAGK